MKLRLTISVEVDVPAEDRPKQTEHYVRQFRDNSEFEARTRVRNWFPGKAPKITSTATVEL